MWIVVEQLKIHGIFTDLSFGRQADEDDNSALSYTDEQSQRPISGVSFPRGGGPHISLRAGHLLDPACTALYNTDLHYPKR